MRTKTFILLTVVMLSFLSLQDAQAGMLGRLLRGGSGGQSRASGEDIAVPAGVTRITDIPYGEDKRQNMDVYMPARGAKGAPVILMVHGGGWQMGDKRNRGVWPSKVGYYVPKGFIFISINYRMLPEADVLTQAQDVAHAIAYAQANAASWGGDPARFMLMGHSAGAHLVAFITAEPEQARTLGVQPWLGTIALDSGALNVVTIMSQRHSGMIYDPVFGTDESYWKATSPTLMLSGRTVPFLAVCSSKRRMSCDQAHEFAERSQSFGNRAEVLEEAKQHGAISAEIGKDAQYTASIDIFLASLDPLVARMLGANY